MAAPGQLQPTRGPHGRRAAQVISARVGHATPAITMAVYARVEPSQVFNLADSCIVVGGLLLTLRPARPAGDCSSPEQGHLGATPAGTPSDVGRLR